MGHVLDDSIPEYFHPIDFVVLYAPGADSGLLVAMCGQKGAQIAVRNADKASKTMRDQQAAHDPTADRTGANVEMLSDVSDGVIMFRLPAVAFAGGSATTAPI